uniref:Uncharacterized protein n=1 Tax=Plectus sambesii TaxID=2011161 RepID=A0A914XAY1_9BILA
MTPASSGDDAGRIDGLGRRERATMRWGQPESTALPRSARIDCADAPRRCGWAVGAPRLLRPNRRSLLAHLSSAVRPKCREQRRSARRGAEQLVGMQHLSDGMLLLMCCVVAAQERDSGEARTIDESGRKSAPIRRRQSGDSAEYVADCKDDAAVVDQLLQDYDKHKLPGGGNVSVIVEIWVQEVSKIIEFTSEFELDIYVTEQWIDPSLAYGFMQPCKQNMSLDGGTLLPQIWSPRACFVNSKDASIHRSPFTNIFLMIYSNGTVWVNYRIKLTGPCNKNLKSFPIDQQSCVLVYESFSHNYEEVKMEWISNGPPITLLNNIQLPDYTLVNFSSSTVKRLYPPGVWNELVATFTFQRLYGFYILQVYVPAYLAVFISWVSFYLGAKNIPSRTTVGVNSLLALTFQFGAIVNNLPKTSDVKAIDVWILSSMGFIFASLLELAVVGYITRYNIANSIKCNCSWLCWKCPEWTANKIDGASAMIFPLCFAVFNVYYWFFFLGRLN